MLNNSYDSTNNNIPRDAIQGTTGTDIFIAVLNSTGSNLIGATYLGGSDEEIVLESMMQFTPSVDRLSNSRYCPFHLQFDSLGNNLWILSNTLSVDFPITNNAFQKSIAGSTDAVLVKINKDCSVLNYSSYLGGFNFDFPTHFVFKGNQQ